MFCERAAGCHKFVSTSSICALVEFQPRGKWDRWGEGSVRCVSVSVCEGGVGSSDTRPKVRCLGVLCKQVRPWAKAGAPTF